MRKTPSLLVQWQEAERAAKAAEFALSQKYMGPQAPTHEDASEAMALRTKASGLLRTFLEDMRTRAAAHRYPW